MAKYCPHKDGPALYLECNECDEKICEHFFCLVVGSRSFTDYNFFASKMDHLLKNKPDVVIVSGGARGTDSLAKRYAEEKGFPYKEFPADWEKHGKSAGYVRNEEMHKYISNQNQRGVVVFWDGKSKGSTHSFSLAEKYNNPIKVQEVQNGENNN